LLGIEMEIERLINKYETFTSDLLTCIRQIIQALSDGNFANSLRGVQEQLGQFNG